MVKKSSEKKEKKKIQEKSPEINIGLFGHVDHGKTTLTEQLSGKWTDTHSEELKRGITIRLGYADTTIRKIKGMKEPECYTTKEKGPNGEETEIVRKITIVDAPGHESLMATMISGATMIDGALLLISATEECPQPQTKEHLMALEILGIENVVIVQNKIDLVSEENAKRNYVQIRKFLKGTRYEKAPIIPISAQYGLNIDLLLDAIEKVIPTPKRDVKKDPLMIVARSFDINKPGTHVKDMKGGILGGILLQGEFSISDEIEVTPVTVVDYKGNKSFKSLKTKIVALTAGSTPVKKATPGGTIGVMVEFDPSIMKSDAMSGTIVGKVGKVPPIIDNISMKLKLLDRVVGIKDELVVEPIRKNEVLMLNVHSATTVGFVTAISKDKIECKLKLPISVLPGSRITISRRIGNRFRLIGYGIYE